MITPTTVSGISETWQQLTTDVQRLFGDVSEAAFFAERGQRWSLAQNLDHLTRSTSAVAQGLIVPKILLRVLFGKATVSRSYEQVREAYQQILLEGGQAKGRFVPGTASSQETALRNWEAVSSCFLRRLEAWDEVQLDRFRMPHPLMGRLTVREMLLFTLYHTRHHLQRAQVA